MSKPLSRWDQFRLRQTKRQQGPAMPYLKIHFQPLQCRVTHDKLQTLDTENLNLLRNRIFYPTWNMQVLQAIFYLVWITDEEAAGAGKSVETDCTVVAVGGGEEESDINSSDHEAQISQLPSTVRWKNFWISELPTLTSIRQGPQQSFVLRPLLRKMSKFAGVK